MLGYSTSNFARSMDRLVIVMIVFVGTTKKVSNQARDILTRGTRNQRSRGNQKRKIRSRSSSVSMQRTRFLFDPLRTLCLRRITSKIIAGHPMMHAQMRTSHK